MTSSDRALTLGASVAEVNPSLVTFLVVLAALFAFALGIGVLAGPTASRAA